MTRRNHLVVFICMLILPIVLSSLQIEANNIQDKVQGSYESPILITKNDFAPTQNKYDSNAITTTTFTGTRNVTAFIGPDAAFELINSTLYQATTSIYLEVYTLSSQALVDALIDMNNTGVEVIVLLSEYRVSGIETDYTERAATQLDSNGIAVWWVERDYYYFTHAKFWIIDHEITFVYSGNWAPSSIPVDNSARENREMGFMFTDTEIATYYENVFFDDLFISFPFTGTYTGSLQSEDSGTYTHPFDTPQTFVENMEITPIFSPDNSYTLIHDLLESATTSIDVELQYIKFDCAFHTDLVNAAKRGVDVRVIIPEPGTANENVTELFLTNGIQMRFFKGLGHNHNKYINVDGEYVVISSINWSNNSVTNNREAGAVVKSTNVASYLTQIFDYDWGNGEEPTGFITPLVISYPSKGEVVYGTYQFGALFSVYNYTSGELYIDDILKHTWTNPSSLETYTIDTTTYANGIHTIKIIGTPTSGPDVEIEHDFNIINADQWKLLISEVRYDATSEPNGEFFELYNGFNFDVYVGDWVVTDNEDDHRLNSEAIIDSKGTLVFVRDGTTFTSEMNGLGLTNPEYDYLYAEVSLANSGDELILKAAGSIKDAVAWGSSSTTLVTPWTGTMNESVSLQREYADVDTDDCSEDFIALLPTPGTVNIYLPFTWPWSGFTIGTTLATIIVVSGISYIYSRKRKK